MPGVQVISAPIPRSSLRQHTLGGSLVKAVVDLGKSIMAVGGELHADEEQALLAEGSRQEDLWGINLYLDQPTDRWLAFDSMINIRPSQGNRSRSVEDPEVQQRIREIVATLILP